MTAFRDMPPGQREQRNSGQTHSEEVIGSTHKLSQDQEVTYGNLSGRKLILDEHDYGNIASETNKAYKEDLLYENTKSDKQDLLYENMKSKSDQGTIQKQITNYSGVHGYDSQSQYEAVDTRSGLIPEHASQYESFDEGETGNRGGDTYQTPRAADAIQQTNGNASYDVPSAVSRNLGVAGLDSTYSRPIKQNAKSFLKSKEGQSDDAEMMYSKPIKVKSEPAKIVLESSYESSPPHHTTTAAGQAGDVTGFSDIGEYPGEDIV